MAPEASPEGQFGRVLAILARHKIDFVLCGGVACLFHGVSRVTGDIDLAVEMSEPNLRRVLDAARELGMRPRIPEPAEHLLDPKRREEWIRTKGALVYTFVHPNDPIQLDIFLAYPIAFAELRERAVPQNVAGETIRISSREDLIRAKKAVQPPRPSDPRDIEDLQRLIDDERS